MFNSRIIIDYQLVTDIIVYLSCIVENVVFPLFK